MAPETIDLIRRLLVQRAAQAAEDARRLREMAARPGWKFGRITIREFEEREAGATHALAEFNADHPIARATSIACASSRAM